MFLNLLSNALKFTSSSGRINITVTILNDKLEVQVQDSGIGISEEDQEKMFGFLNSTHRMNTKGIGLGLYICKHIVEEFDGKIHVKSAPRMGSNFTFFMMIPKHEDKIPKIEVNEVSHEVK